TVVRIIHTPGHTPESICLLVTDLKRGDRPWFVLTGDTLFVAAVGRPDLPGRARENAAELYASIHDRLLTLPGLRANAAQFSLLVLVNAFVGGMVGMERSILPAIAESEFHVAARVGVLSFIVVFGIAKAITNYFAGRFSDRFGRKHVLVCGWIVAAPVPLL